jgi:hypothetical protein
MKNKRTLKLINEIPCNVIEKVTKTIKRIKIGGTRK